MERIYLIPAAIIFAIWFVAQFLLGWPIASYVLFGLGCAAAAVGIVFASIAATGWRG